MTAADEAADPGFAPAKVNLFLHLRGQRPDGYHLLESLVAFAGVGDRVEAQPAATLTLATEGPFASSLETGSNLVLGAAKALARLHGLRQGASLRLEKRLPVAAGIGGGSSDAAATLRVLSRLWGVGFPDGLALELGADVPVCVHAPAPRMVSGIGEVLGPAPALPDCRILLVNPGAALPTRAVFAGVTDRSPLLGPALPPEGIARFDAFREWLGTQRNDLQDAALALCPVIAEVLAALSDAPLARMSGSGATCFALFPDRTEARRTAERIRHRTDWWVAEAALLRAP